MLAEVKSERMISGTAKSVGRQSNIEVLRIFAMLYIVCSHCIVHGLSAPSGAIVPEFNGVLLDICYLGGHLGNDLFILISAYFMVDIDVSIKKLARLWGTVFFYSVSIFCCFIT